MINFGTSAYLKILALNPRPKDTQLKNRLTPSDSGYDFHRSMRQIAPKFAAGKLDAEAAVKALSSIKKTPERKSAAKATNNLIKWLGGREIIDGNLQEQKTTSPSELFSVKFSPDFNVVIDGKLTAVHIWNTAKPELNGREAVGTMGLFSELYQELDIAVLCLQRKKLFKLGERTQSKELARILALDIEKRIIRIQKNLKGIEDTEHKSSSLGL